MFYIVLQFDGLYIGVQVEFGFDFDDLFVIGELVVGLLNGFVVCVYVFYGI